MWFNKKRKNDISYYQCQIIFSHTNFPIDIFIESEREGISPSQKALFFEFEKRYEEILSTIKAPIQERIKKRNYYNDLNMKLDFHIWSLVIFSKQNDNQFSIGLSSDKYNMSNIRLAIKDFKFNEFLD
jgi:hypothetical protein